MKRKLNAVLVLIGLLTSVLFGCTSNVVQEEKTTIRIGAMSGPTAMGLVKLKNDSEEGKTENDYSFLDFASDPSAFVTPLATGEVDIAALPSNLAANLYNNNDGKVSVIAVNTLGVLNLVERGETIKDISDLKGKTIYATGVGAVPEYTIKHILTKNDINPDKDVDLIFCSDTTEALSKLKTTSGAIAILPQPFVTVAKAQISDLRIVFDLNDLWSQVEKDCNIVTGVLVVRKEFAEKYPKQLEKFLEEYKESVEYTNTNVDEAAELIAKEGIVKSSAIAKVAIPDCHLVCLTDSEAKGALEGFLNILYDKNPKAIGGKMPGDDFYYGCE